MKEKSLLKNSFYFILYRVINVIYPLLTATYVSRVLQPSGIGEVSLAQTIVIFLVAVALLGIPNYGVREVGKTLQKENLNKIFSELIIINFVSTSIVLILYYSFIFVCDFKINKTLYYIEGMILFLNYINVDWFYQGKEEFKYITIRSCIIKLVSIFAIFAFVKTQDDTCIYAFIFSMAYAGNYLFNLFNLKKFVKFSIKGINPFKHLKGIIILAVTYISNEIYVTVDSIMLGIMTTNAYVGYYSNSMKVIKILVNVCTAIGTTLLPRLSLLKSQKNNEEINNIINTTIKVLLFFTLPAVLGISLVSKELIIVLFGVSFSPAADILKILSLLVIFRTFSNLFLQVLIVNKKDKNTSKVYFVAMISNILMNYILINCYQAKGASIASVIAELFIMISLYIYTRKEIEYKIDNKYLFSILFSLICMMIVVIITNFLVEAIFIKLILEVLFGIVIYVWVNIVLKNEILIELIKRGVKRDAIASQE